MKNKKWSETANSNRDLSIHYSGLIVSSPIQSFQSWSQRCTEVERQIRSLPIIVIEGKQYYQVPMIPRWGLYRLVDVDDVSFEVYYRTHKKWSTKDSNEILIKDIRQNSFISHYKQAMKVLFRVKGKS